MLQKHSKNIVDIPIHSLYYKNMQLEEKLYTSTEVAKILGVSLRSVYRYLEQGKLDAEIKTATGRLRFTKQDILNFLYPDGEEPAQKQSRAEKPSQDSSQAATKAAEPETKEEEEEEEEKPSEEEEEALAPKAVPDTKPAAEEKDEEVDWLAKFREAAQGLAVDTSDVKEAESKESVSALSSDDAQEEVFRYYKSMLGGLKEIAQNLDKVGRKANVDYAFTLYAGLSLEKPLKKPFSLLHAYVSPESEELFTKMLQLEPSDEKNAQLCLILSDDPSVFANKEEKHGLYVVSDDQLNKDFQTFGLESELKSLL